MEEDFQTDPPETVTGITSESGNRAKRGKGSFPFQSTASLLCYLNFFPFTIKTKDCTGGRRLEVEGRLCGRGHPEFRADYEGEASAKGTGARLLCEQSYPLQGKPDPVSTVG